MTKVQVRFHLRKPLDDTDYQGIATAHAKYGIYKITVEPSLQDLLIEYDATRLRPAEIESTLACAGIPIDRTI